VSKSLALSTGILSIGLLSTPLALADDAKASVDAILDSIVVPEPAAEPIVVAPTPEKDMNIAPSDTSDTELPNPLKTEVEFGYQSHSGNSDSRSLNARLSGEYTAGRHRTSGEWKYYNLYKDGEEDKRQSTYSAQSDYKLSPKTYLYGSFKGIDSRYSAYFKDYTVSSGLGYQFSNTEEFVLEVEVGPGFRYQEPNLDEIDSDDIIFPEVVEEAIFRSNVNTSWQVLPNLLLKADVTLVSGHSNLNFDTDLEVINNITDSIALKLAHSRQYHDKVPEGLSQEDSVMSISLLFTF
jgi:putative salt-induced outer membrane protein